ncbi:MAG: class 3, partial [Verrucomicrobia bacterium]
MAALLFSGIFSDRSFALLEQLDTYTEDLRSRMGRPTPVAPELVLIGIDRPKYAETDFSEDMLREAPVLRELQEEFPWSRVVWAELLEKLVGAGAKVVAFDLVFSSRNKGDARLREALERYRSKVVIGVALSPEETNRGEFLQLVTPNPGVLPAEDTAALLKDDRVGYIHVPLDSDGVLRRVHFRQADGRAAYLVRGGAVMESLTTRALVKFGRPDLVPASLGTTRFRYGSAPGEGYKVHNIGDVLNPDLWRKNYGNGAFFRGKLVVVGPTAEIFNDNLDTPFAEKKMSGVELHLSVLAAALKREFLTETPLYLRLFIILLSGFLAGVLSFHNFHPGERLATMLITVGAYWVLAQWFFDRLGWIVPVAGPLFALGVSSVLILLYDFLQERLDRMKLRSTMSLYFSPTVLKSVLKHPGSMQPKHADVTLLLTDLRNFTRLDEALEPQAFFDLLNKVFELQTDAIMRQHGNIEHFLGDQFLSYWGAPEVQPDAAQRSLRAALALIAGMQELHKTLPAPIA